MSKQPVLSQAEFEAIDASHADLLGRRGKWGIRRGLGVDDRVVHDEAGGTVAVTHNAYRLTMDTLGQIVDTHNTYMPRLIASHRALQSQLAEREAENERFWLALRDIAYGEIDADLMEKTARTALSTPHAAPGDEKKGR